MARLENPVLTYELRSRLRIPKLIPAILLRCICLGLLFCLVLLSDLGKGLLAFILAETVLILLFTPGAVCRSFRQGDLRDLALTRLSASAILLGKFVAADIYTFLITTFSAIIMCAVALFHSDLYVWRLICANIALLILVFSSAVIGLAFSIVLRRNSLVAYILIYMLILFLIGSVIIPGPLMERVQSKRAKAAMAKLALYANPLIMTSRALEMRDLMRSTTYMYVLAAPILDWGFTYPDWYSAGIVYSVISLILLIPICLGFRYHIRYGAGYTIN